MNIDHDEQQREVDDEHTGNMKEKSNETRIIDCIKY